jgi:hypothetical protein
MADKATPAINGAAKPAANPTPTPITAPCIFVSASAPSPPALEFVLFPILIANMYFFFLQNFISEILDSFRFLLCEEDSRIGAEVCSINLEGMGSSLQLSNDGVKK